MIWTIPTHVININLLFSGNLHILLYINIHFQLYKTMTNLFFSVYIALCLEYGRFDPHIFHDKYAF